MGGLQTGFGAVFGAQRRKKGVDFERLSVCAAVFVQSALVFTPRLYFVTVVSALSFSFFLFANLWGKGGGKMQFLGPLVLFTCGRKKQ